jgi:hypothetical protein
VDLLAAWLLYPLALAVLCVGVGLLIERAAGWRLPGALLLPAGFAGLVVLARIATVERATAPYALALLVVLALAGLVADRARLRALRPDPWLTLAALAVFAVLAAPVVASGKPSLAGYLALPDTGHQLALAQMLADRGTDWQSLVKGSSTYEGIAPYMLTSYPIGGQALLGVTAPLGVIDLAWLYQPLLSFMAVVLSLALGSIAAPWLARRWHVAVVAFVAATPALVVGFALQGSIKELATVALLTTTVALVAAALAERRPARSLVVPAVAAAAALEALGPATLLYLAIPGLVAIAVWGLRCIRERKRAEIVGLLAAGATAVVLSLPVLTTLSSQIYVQSNVLKSASGATGAAAEVALGNLAQPLDTSQALGIWLSGDYRYHTLEPSLQTPQQVALWLAGLLALLGLGWAIARRAWGPLLLAGLLLPSAYLLARGSPYADAKVLTLASPPLMLLSILGAASLWRRRAWPLSVVAGGALLAGVLASSALAYHDVSLAPHDRFQELLSIDDRLAGKGPALLNEYDEFAKYLLSKVPSFNEPESDHAYRNAPYHPNARVDPKRRPSEKTPLDMDDLPLSYIEEFPYLILRRSPLSSRPPANYERISSGTFYDVWKRDSAPKVLHHLPLGGDVLRPAAVVTTKIARTWASRARREGGRLAYVQRPRPSLFYLSHHPRPIRWGGFGSYPDALVTDGPGSTNAPVKLPRTGRYDVWVEGSFDRRITLMVDFHVIGRTPVELNNPGAYSLLGTAQLKRGLRGVQVRQGGGNLRPGNGGYRSSLRHIGPIVLEPVQDQREAVTQIAASQWRSLVGRRVDWIEIVR